MGFLRLMSGLLDRLCIVAGAFLGSQIPQFINQYTQRLAGHVEELSYFLDQLYKMSNLSNKSLDQYIYKFLSDSDPDFVRQGEFMQNIVMRWQNLSYALENMAKSSMWTRPYAFIRNMNYEIAQSTFDSFQPGLSLTLEGIYYTGMGLTMGFLFYQLLAKLVKITCQASLICFNKLFRRKQILAQ